MAEAGPPVVTITRFTLYCQVSVFTRKPSVVFSIAVTFSLVFMVTFSCCNIRSSTASTAWACSAYGYIQPFFSLKTIPAFSKKCRVSEKEKAENTAGRHPASWL